MAEASTIETSGFFALRTPLLPFEDVERLAGGNGSEGEARVHARLREVLRREDVAEALYLASPELAEPAEAWIRGDAAEHRHVDRALIRYVLRMATRPTPFGLFAGTSVGTIGPRTRLNLEGRRHHRRHSTLDVEYLASIARTVACSPEVRDSVPYRPNQSIYQAGRSFRYVEERGEADRRSQHLVSLTGTGALEAVLGAAAEGPGGRTSEELVHVLTVAGTEERRAARLVARLVDDQALVPDIGVEVTGDDPLAALIRQLRPYAGAKAATECLEAVARVLAELDAAGVGATRTVYDRVAAALDPLPVRPDPTRLVRVDLVKASPGATLGAAVVDELRRGIQALHRLARRPAADDLEQFRADFVRRYGQREVPLLEALDRDAGVGFGPRQPTAPLLENLPTYDPPPADTGWRSRDEALLPRVAAAAERRDAELVLDEADVDTLVDDDPAPLPNAFLALASVGARSDDALDRGDFFVHLRAAGGPSGAWLLGRQCRIDGALAGHVQGHLAAEEALDPDAVFAEIVHQPAGRFGNVVLRPVMRSHEIEYLGRSGAPPDRRIGIDDLRVSVRGDAVVLRSATSGRRVVPRLTAAHTYGVGTVPVYRFLCSLQTHGVTAGLAWRWGPLASLPYLPRVRIGRTVVSPARWRLPGSAVSSLRAPAARQAAGLPRFVQLVDGDQALVVDFDNPVSVGSFAHLVRRRPEVVVEELLPGPDDLCARSPEGRFVHELVVPFVNPPPLRPVKAVALASRVETTRTFVPGSEWLYAKLYTAGSLADTVLRDAVAPLVGDLFSSGVIESFHFVRYADPDWHLRLRFGAPAQSHRTSESLDAAVRRRVEALARRAVEHGEAWRLQLDTYEREVERYGGPEGVLVAEAVFSADSRAVLDVLRELGPGDSANAARWQVALAGAHCLFEDFGVGVEDRLALLRTLRESFAREFGADAQLEDGLSRRFRVERSRLNDLLYGERDETGAAGRCLALLDRRSASVGPLVAELRSLERGGKLSAGVGHIAAAHVHMHLNRLFAADHRLQELVIYDFLLRLERSHAARQDRKP